MSAVLSTPSLRGKVYSVPAEPTGKDHDFLWLSRGYRTFGGLTRGAELADRWPNGSLTWLARRIASREVVSFDWRGDLWLPTFQFASSEPRVTSSARTLIAELAPALEDWELAQWFVAPNAWLQNATPLESMREDFERVHDAARAHRFACIS